MTPLNNSSKISNYIYTFLFFFFQIFNFLYLKIPHISLFLFFLISDIYFSAAGIYSPIEILDFGVLRSQDEPKVLTLSLLNAGQKHVHIVVCSL